MNLNEELIQQITKMVVEKLEAASSSQTSTATSERTESRAVFETTYWTFGSRNGKKIT